MNSHLGIRSDRAVQHMEDPETVLYEIVRVTKPGGVVVISEPNWETLTIDSQQKRFDTPHRSLNVRLTDVKVTAFPFVLTDYSTADRIWGLQRHAQQACEAGVITANELLLWHEELSELDRRRHFFTSTVGFLAIGRKLRDNPS